jgi:hypothetical protein
VVSEPADVATLTSVVELHTAEQVGPGVQQNALVCKLRTVTVSPAGTLAVVGE